MKRRAKPLSSAGYLPKRSHRYRSNSGHDGDEEGETPWRKEVHRSFVEAIFDVGMRHSSPSIIMDCMTTADKSVTSERVKSHLQKFRSKEKKSKQEFMDEYDRSLQSFLMAGVAEFNTGISPPESVRASVLGSDNLLGGEAAAILTYQIMYETGALRQINSNEEISISDQAVRVSSLVLANKFSGKKIDYPVLTQAEQESPLGVMWGQVMNLFYPMTQWLMNERLQTTTTDITTRDEQEMFNQKSFDDGFGSIYPLSKTSSFDSAPIDDIALSTSHNFQPQRSSFTDLRSGGRFDP